MKFDALFLLIPAGMLVVVGVWGWRNAATMARSMPLDERTQERRRRTYRRGSVACIVVAVAFVALIVISYSH